MDFYRRGLKNFLNIFLLKKAKIIKTAVQYYCTSARKGYGKKLLASLASLAMERNCGRMEWAVLDWNEPSIEFYKSLGARMMDEWIVNRMTGESLTELAGKY